MEDTKIIALFFDRNEQAVKEMDDVDYVRLTDGTKIVNR